MQWSALPLTSCIGRHLTLTSISGRLSTLSPIPWSSRALSRTVNYRTSAWYRVRHSFGDSISDPTPTVPWASLLVKDDLHAHQIRPPASQARRALSTRPGRPGLRHLSHYEPAAGGDQPLSERGVAAPGADGVGRLPAGRTRRPGHGPAPGRGKRTRAGYGPGRRAAGAAVT